MTGPWTFALPTRMCVPITLVSAGTARQAAACVTRVWQRSPDGTTTHSPTDTWKEPPACAPCVRAIQLYPKRCHCAAQAWGFLPVCLYAAKPLKLWLPGGGLPPLNRLPRPGCQVRRPCSLYSCAARAWRPRPSSQTRTARLWVLLPPPACFGLAARLQVPTHNACARQPRNFSLPCRGFPLELPATAWVSGPYTLLHVPVLVSFEAARVVARAASCLPCAGVPGPDTLFHVPMLPSHPLPDSHVAWVRAPAPAACLNRGCGPILTTPQPYILD